MLNNMAVIEWKRYFLSQWKTIVLLTTNILAQYQYGPVLYLSALIFCYAYYFIILDWEVTQTCFKLRVFWGHKMGLKYLWETSISFVNWTVQNMFIINMNIDEHCLLHYYTRLSYYTLSLPNNNRWLDWRFLATAHHTCLLYTLHTSQQNCDLSLTLTKMLFLPKPNYTWVCGLTVLIRVL